MNRSQQDRLLSECLTGDEVAPIREQSLAHSLLWLRRRGRRRRQAKWMSASVAALLTVGIFAVHRGAIRFPSSGTASQTQAIITPQPDRVEVKIITAQELAALFPERPLALIGKPGQQRLVFLDE